MATKEYFYGKKNKHFVMQVNSRSTYKHDCKQSGHFFNLPDYQFIIKLCVIVSLLLTILFSCIIQSSNAAATDLNALRKFLIGKSFPKIANDSVIVTTSILNIATGFQDIHIHCMA